MNGILHERRFVWPLACASLLAVASCSEARVDVETASRRAPPSTAILDFQLLNGDDGWVLTEDQMSRTADGGETWTDVTPPRTDPEAILDSFFLDPLTGWAIASRVEGRGGQSWVLHRSVDGGRTWIPSPFPADSATYGSATTVHLDFADPLHGWALATRPSSSNFSLGDLFRTRDGGVTWDVVPAPIGGRVSLVGPSLGWVAGGATGSELYASRDGGASWQRVRLPPPRAFRDGTPSYDSPTFFDEREGALPVTFTGAAAGSGLAFYTTNDGGKTWTLPASTIPSRRSIAMGVRMPTDPVTPDTWFGVDPQEDGRVIVVLDAGANASAMADAGFPEGAFHLDFGDRATGWLATGSGSCGRGKTDCRYVTQLFRTTTGGETWDALTPP